MLFSRDWLGEYVELPSEAGELGRRLTFAGMAVEGIEERGRDVLLDVDVTTNRPDCMCHLGLAREVAVLFDRTLRPPPGQVPLVEGEAGRLAEVAIEDEAAAACPRYVARLLRGVRVGPSPGWLVERLEAVGLRSINNVVDVTNYVLWEHGQPLHAFDLARLAGRRVVVRWARPGEELVTLDGERRGLDPGILVIADAERPVALAGILGGRDSEVSAATTEVLLESAHFDRVAVRAGARRLGLHTDASHRFERGADPGACLEAAGRAAALLAELAGAEVVEGALDRRPGERDWRLHGWLELSRLEAFAGAAVPASEVERVLAGLGFSVERRDAGRWRVRVPTWRYYDFAATRPDGDVYEADLFEEVLRVHGFDSVPASLPALAGPDAGSSLDYRRRLRIQRLLAGFGYLEAIHYAFQEEGADARFAAVRRNGEALRIANPLSKLHVEMRRSLVPNLLGSARFNLRRGASSVRLFELGHLFPGGDSEEVEAVALLAGGEVGTPWQRPIRFDLFDVKGALEELAAAFGVTLEARPAEVQGTVPGTAAELLAGGVVAGLLGQIEEGDAPFPLYAGELLTSVLPAEPEVRPVTLPSRYPGVEVDLTLTHPREVTWRQIEEVIRRAAPRDLASFRLKDRYEGPEVPAGAVNTTMTFLYNAADRSLTQEEVNERQERLAKEMAEHLGFRK